MKPYLSVRQERGRVGCRCCPDKAERGTGRRGNVERDEAEEEGLQPDAPKAESMRNQYRRKCT